MDNVLWLERDDTYYAPHPQQHSPAECGPVHHTNYSDVSNDMYHSEQHALSPFLDSSIFFDDWGSSTCLRDASVSLYPDIFYHPSPATSNYHERSSSSTSTPYASTSSFDSPYSDQSFPYELTQSPSDFENTCVTNLSSLMTSPVDFDMFSATRTHDSFSQALDDTNQMIHDDDAQFRPEAVDFTGLFTEQLPIPGPWSNVQGDYEQEQISPLIPWSPFNDYEILGPYSNSAETYESAQSLASYDSNCDSNSSIYTPSVSVPPNPRSSYSELEPNVEYLQTLQQRQDFEQSPSQFVSASFSANALPEMEMAQEMEMEMEQRRGREYTPADQNHRLGRPMNPYHIDIVQNTGENIHMDRPCSSPRRRREEDQSISLSRSSQPHLQEELAQDLVSHEFERSANPHDAYLALPSSAFPSSPSYPHSLRGPGIEGGIPLPPRRDETILTGWTPPNGQEYEVVKLPFYAAPSPPSHPCPPVPRKQKRQQTLACLFCRERKIACGRPSEEYPDQTCNQCARRNFVCEYPESSRRGHHSRRVLNKPDVDAPGPSSSLFSVDHH